MTEVECEPMLGDEDGWSEWIHPTPSGDRGYLMQCCDCGLIHEMQFNIAEPMPGMGDAERNPGEGDDGVVIFRARRWPRDTTALRRMVALDEEMGLYDDGEVVPPADAP